MKRNDYLDAAKGAINRTVYGEPEDNFQTTADHWNAHLRALARRRGVEPVTIEAHDVAIMMTSFKLARLVATPTKSDTWIDAAGYAACGAEIIADGNTNRSGAEADHAKSLRWAS